MRADDTLWGLGSGSEQAHVPPVTAVGNPHALGQKPLTFNRSVRPPAARYGAETSVYLEC